MVASYTGVVEFAGGATTVVDIDDLDAPSWRGRPRLLFSNHANPPAVWLVGVHLLEGPRAGQYANADLHHQPPPFFAGREPFGEAPPNVLPRHPLSSNPAPRVIDTQSLCPRCGGHQYIQLTTSHSCCSDCGLGRVSQPLRLETSSPPLAPPRPSSPERERLRGELHDTAAPRDKPSLERRTTRLPSGELGAQPRTPSPGEAKLRAHHERLMADPAAHFGEASFQPFGLDDQWTGLRSIGGSGTSDGAISSLTLTHGDPYDETGPLVRVTTVSHRHVHGDPAVDRAIERSLLVRQLVGFMWRTTGNIDPEVRAAAFDPGRTPPDPTAPWEPVTIPIDGDPTGGHLLEQDNAWVALTERDGLLVAIEGQRWPRASLGLRTVDPDALQEYVQGSALIRNQRMNPPAS